MLRIWDTDVPHDSKLRLAALTEDACFDVLLIRTTQRPICKSPVSYLFEYKCRVVECQLAKFTTVADAEPQIRESFRIPESILLQVRHSSVGLLRRDGYLPQPPHVKPFLVQHVKVIVNLDGCPYEVDEGMTAASFVSDRLLLDKSHKIYDDNWREIHAFHGKEVTAHMRGSVKFHFVGSPLRRVDDVPNELEAAKAFEPIRSVIEVFPRKDRQPADIVFVTEDRRLTRSFVELKPEEIVYLSRMVTINCLWRDSRVVTSPNERYACPGEVIAAVAEKKHVPAYRLKLVDEKGDRVCNFSGWEDWRTVRVVELRIYTFELPDHSTAEWHFADRDRVIDSIAKNFRVAVPDMRLFEYIVDNESIHPGVCFGELKTTRILVRNRKDVEPIEEDE
jgi:hypothetical protein